MTGTPRHLNVSYILHKPFDLAVSGDLAGIGTVEEEHGVALGPASHPPTGGLELGKQSSQVKQNPFWTTVLPWYATKHGQVSTAGSNGAKAHRWPKAGSSKRSLEGCHIFPSVAKDDAGRPTSGHRLVCLRELQVPCVSHMAFLPLPCLTLRRPVGECFFPSPEYRVQTLRH